MYWTFFLQNEDNGTTTNINTITFSNYYAQSRRYQSECRKLCTPSYGDWITGVWITSKHCWSWAEKNYPDKKRALRASRDLCIWPAVQRFPAFGRLRAKDGSWTTRGWVLICVCPSRELTRRTSGSEPCTEIVSCFEATVRTSSHGTSKWLAVWEASKKLNCSSCILAKCRATSRTAEK